MIVYCDGHPVVVDIIAHTDSVVLYKRSDTVIKSTDNGYCICNVYSGAYGKDDVTFHYKLKLYECVYHGYYVNARHRRCYVNSLMTDSQMKELGIYRLY